MGPKIVVFAVCALCLWGASPAYAKPKNAAQPPEPKTEETYKTPNEIQDSIDRIYQETQDVKMGELKISIEVNDFVGAGIQLLF